MDIKESKAEIKVYEKLSQQNLTAGMDKQYIICLRHTIPDFTWPSKRRVVYLDGDVIHKIGDENDEEIDNLLERQHWSVKRIRYTAPLSEKRLKEIVAEIREFIGE